MYVPETCVKIIPTKSDEKQGFITVWYYFKVCESTGNKSVVEKNSQYVWEAFISCMLQKYCSLDGFFPLRLIW